MSNNLLGKIAAQVLLTLFVPITYCYAEVRVDNALTLNGLIRDALKSYPGILSRQANQDAAKSDLVAAKLRFLPNPSISTLRNQTTYDGASSANLPATSLTISQPLFMGGGTVAGYNKADARLNATDFSLLEAREDIARRLVNSYAEWLKSYNKIVAFEESVRLHERFSALITNRLDAGVSSGSDRDLGISRLYQARAELDTQLSIEKTALSSISELAGYPVSRIDLLSKLAKPMQLPDRSAGISQAIISSVALQRSRYESEAAEAEAKETRAQAFPQILLQAQRQIGNAYLPGAPGYNMVGLVVQYAPGGGLSSFASSSAAFDRARSAAFQVDTLKRDLTDKLNADYNEFEFSRLKVNSLRSSAQLSGDIGASYDRQYLVGRKSWVDLMNSMREKAQNRAALADAEGSLIASSYRLYIYINGLDFLDRGQEMAQSPTK